ncbi:hypothetical protein AGMMS49975_16020 [Clostridia bacterium]|nr:hypothetical protein AGMMS49975_16020 [Clostridia bacterium]
MTLVECWAYARRKFDEALKALPKEDRVNAFANIGFVYCNKLLELERQYDEMNVCSQPITMAYELPLGGTAGTLK